ncbi:MAG TPA: hypothetical protein VM328_11980 [Fimbriimonadaceae bacterium]|nr:hypothetical protein [Fimbriimonadaceae bacterium]
MIRGLALLLIGAAITISSAGAAAPGAKLQSTSPIFYYRSGGVWKMGLDGSGNALLCPAEFKVRPSYRLHGGQRWFTTTWDTMYPQFIVTAEDGRQATIFTDGDGGVELDLGAWIQWMPGDSAVSFLGRRWVNGQVVEVGVYSVALLFDGGGNIVGAHPPVLRIGTPAYGSVDDPYPDCFNSSWSPSGDAIVFSRWQDNRLWIAGSGGLRVVYSGSPTAVYPAWGSTDKIAFYRFGSKGQELCVMGSNGAGLKVLATLTAKTTERAYIENPSWSDDGAWVVYGERISKNDLYSTLVRRDVVKVPVAGGKVTNLTSSINDPCLPMRRQ